MINEYSIEPFNHPQHAKKRRNLFTPITSIFVDKNIGHSLRAGIHQTEKKA